MISLIVPSRYRPAALVQMETTARATADSPSRIEVVAVVDEDDPQRERYEWKRYPLPTRVIVGPRRTHSDLWNVGAAAAEGDVLMVAADDLRFRSDGWDSAVREAAGEHGDGLALVHCRDGHEDRCTHPFVTRRWVETVGRLAPPYFVGDYVDLWLWEVAKAAGRCRMVGEHLIEHMHYSYGKGDRDACHEERLARMTANPPVQVWEDTAGERQAEVARLREAMG